MVYSSAIIHYSSNNISKVKSNLEALPGVEVLDDAESKIAVVIEAESTELLAELSDGILKIDDILQLEIVSHFFEDELINKINN